jgi:hypothetical protein
MNPHYDRLKEEEMHQKDERWTRNTAKRARNEECRLDRELGETTKPTEKKEPTNCPTMEIIKGVLNATGS